MKRVSIFTRLRYFFVAGLCFVIITSIIAVLTSKIESHLFINHFHTQWFDIFFKYYTNIGDGVFALILLPYFLFWGTLRTFLITMGTCMISGLLAQFFKRLIFCDILRPSGIFKDGILHFVDGVHLHQSYSFPSGHTASAFAFFTIMAFLFHKNRLVQILFAFLAILAGFSRVYLSQHFLIDTIGGAIIGIIGFLISYKLIIRLKVHCVYDLSIWECIVLTVHNRLLR